MNHNLLAVAVVQLCSTDDYAMNLQRVGSAIRKAVRKNVDLIAFPENSLYLRPEGEPIYWNEGIQQRLIERLQTLASTMKVNILVGSMPESIPRSKKIYNASILISNTGKVHARYRKMHLFDVTLPDGKIYHESKFIQPGKAICNTDVKGWNLGLSICYDLRFPELYRRLKKNGADILMVPASFTVPTGKSHWETLLRARAIENQCFVIAPAQTGVHSPSRESYGHSMVIDPWGEIIASTGTKETIIYATLDKEILKIVRHRMPCWENRVLSV